MLNNAYILISEDLKNSKKEELQDKIKIFNEFTLAVDRMIAGEYVDTEYEGKPISEDYLEYIHKNKTGAFLKLSVFSILILLFLINSVSSFLHSATKIS